MKNVLLLFGGGGTEHEISVISAGHIYESLKAASEYQVFAVELLKDRTLRLYSGEIGVGKESRQVELSGWGRLELKFVQDKEHKSFYLDLVIPCIHGYPGETGDVQSWFALLNLPYFGCTSEGNILAFNKVSTKLWLSSLGIPNTPYTYLEDQTDECFKRAKSFFQEAQSQGALGVFVKPSHQGSSVGCYRALKESELLPAIKNAFYYSPYVLIEKLLDARELEISIYEYKRELHASYPGEIITPDHFYSYEEKYSQVSKTKTVVKAEAVSEETVKAMQAYALRAFRGLKLRHISRVDFFLTTKGEVYLNEINTFPGMTPISMFPKMMEQNGHRFSDYILDSLAAISKN
ncbi:MAG: D-alanine--D-alanine ligase [Oligoflexia bacterium]|nr:D-alanine--D-alanine ligase [Oligoflexia bacterium]MBF0366259.1 D-alanine--D-alanine ligase [Oligoflexia bacterium]